MLRIEVVEVRQKITQAVPNVLVRLDDAREDLLAEADLLRVFTRRNPQSQDVGAACFQESAGSMEFPSDFDIFRPSSATTNPLVTTSR